jgi:hypothetical protein
MALTRNFDPSLLISAHYEVHVRHYERAVLSVPALHEGAVFKAKDLLAVGEDSTDGKYTVNEHLQFLNSRDAIRSDRPLLVLGMRNNLVNLRAPVIWQGRAHAVDGEQPERSVRPYYGLGSRAGKLVMDCALGAGHKPQEWPEFFCAGVPVLWEGLDDESLFDLMLAEAADHSHIFELPRGHHPLATNETRAAWTRLHDVFVQQLYADQHTSSRAMRQALEQFEPPLRRCDSYLHAILGARQDGGLMCLFAHGRLENLGRIAERRGCRSGICIENSGSVMPTILPEGLSGEMIPLVRAPNFRPQGRVALVLELSDMRFEVFLACGE